MASSNTSFTESIAEDLKKYDGVRVPLKAGFFERFFTRSISCDSLHPNPDDEFSIPSIGPSFKIISDYENGIRKSIRNGNPPCSDWEDPLFIQKMYPEGYMLLNGHHRWAAAKRVGVKKVPVRIVNPTREEDIREMLKSSIRNMRVTFDLDEVAFTSPDGSYEKPLLFPFNRIYKEKIRRGFPMLCHFMSTHGFDIWVYTSEFYSPEHIKSLFKKYHVNITGVITGTARSARLASSSRRNIEKMMKAKYDHTVNVYDDMVLLVHSSDYDFEEFDLDLSRSEWSQEVKTAVKSLLENEE